MSAETFIPKDIDTCQCVNKNRCDCINSISHPASVNELPGWASKYDPSELLKIIGVESITKNLNITQRNVDRFYIGNRLIAARILYEKKRMPKKSLIGDDGKIVLNPDQVAMQHEFPFHATRLKMVTGIQNTVTIEEISKSIWGSGYLNNSYSYTKLIAGEIYSLYDNSGDIEPTKRKINEYILMYHSSVLGVVMYFLSPSQVITLYTA